MFLLILILIFICILIPLGIAWRIWRLDEPSFDGWLLKIAVGIAFATFILLIGRWDIAGFYTRYAVLALLVLAIILSGLHHSRRPWLPPDGKSLWRSHFSTLFSLILFAGGSIYVASGFLAEGKPHRLAVPLEGGRFMAVQGGNNKLLNYHHNHAAQRYAADIVAINAAGFRSSGMMPADPRRYVAYGAAVVSPCDGRIVTMRNDLPDQNPPTADRKNPAGNNVTIACDGMLVELAHLKRGSIAIGPGAAVSTGERIGLVGNSGNTSEPHLHIHAVDPTSGRGVEIALDGSIPARNRIFDR